jgi:hypothetical protein
MSDLMSDLGPGFKRTSISFGVTQHALHETRDLA